MDDQSTVEANQLSLYTSAGSGAFQGLIAAVLTHFVPAMVGTISLVLMFNLGAPRRRRGWNELSFIGGMIGAFVAYFAGYVAFTTHLNGWLAKTGLCILIAAFYAVYCALLVQWIVLKRLRVIAHNESLSHKQILARPLASTERWEEPYFAALRGRMFTGRRPFLLLVRSGAWCALAVAISIALYGRFNSPVLIAIAASVFLYQSIVFTRELRYLQGLILSETDIKDAVLDRGSAPVLLLRPFSLDELSVDPAAKGCASFFRMLAVHELSFEEVIEHTFKEIGPLVAIGRPGEVATPLGASRAYADESSWRRVVLEQARLARLVILVIDATPSVEWEFEHVSARVGLQRMVILVPPLVDDEDDVLFRRDQGWRNLRGRFPDLPELSEEAAAVVFDSENDPTLVETKASSIEERLTKVKEAWLAAAQ